MAKNNKKFGRITLKILIFLEELFDFADAFVSSSYSTRLFHQKLRENDLKIGYFSQKLYQLEKSGYVKVKRDEQKNLSVKLTTKGKIKILENASDNTRDGRWRLLSFDIPEKERQKRDLFRSAIKRIGFKQVQKSLWACPYVEADKIELAIDYYKVKKYVAYLIVEKSNIQLHLTNLFKNNKRLFKRSFKKLRNIN